MQNGEALQAYLVLLRGINVGGKNKVAMADLKMCLENLGCQKVQSYINSGNVIVQSDKKPAELAKEIEDILPKKFKLDSELIRILVVSHKQLQQVIAKAPKGFGTEPDIYYSDAIFLIDVSAEEAFKIFKPREGVDAVWQGDMVIYSRRLGVERTKSRLSAIMASPLYKQMTIRSWSTTTKLLDMMNASR